MKTIKTLRHDILSGRYNTAFAAFVLAIFAVAMPEAAYAQANPFENANNAADQVVDSLAGFALAVGGIGMISCLLLGFFGKLNWKWVATGIGVSFGIAIVPTAIGWLNSIAGV